MSDTTQTHDKTASALLDSKHAALMPDDVLAGWKCGLKMVPNSTENIVTIHKNDCKDIVFAINEMEDAGYEVVNIHFDTGVVEFMK